MTPAEMDPGEYSSGHKRPRAASMYQRKRSLAACQPCRARKTKCDNVKPSCGFCTQHGAQCTYADTKTDHSSFDPASLAILERLNHVVSLLEKDKPESPQNQNNSQTSAPDPLPLNQHTDLEDPDHEDDMLEETPNFPAAQNNCEGVLQWPIFQDYMFAVDSFVQESEQDKSISAEVRSGTKVLGRGIQEEDFASLSKKFLTYIHTKNPILDVGEFSIYVKDAAETGLRWDGPSCLVLIACALGCLVTPFWAGDKNDDTQARSAAMLVNRQTSEEYYLAATKRLGQMRPSLLYIQCLFFCGVFEMFRLDPLQAWYYFNLACVQFRNLLWRHRHFSSSSMSQIPRQQQRMEQRLYWSCMKSECELRCEIPVPASGINRFGFPKIFPSPPNELSTPPDQADADSPSEFVNPEEEKGWFYYLAEISHRRMMNRSFATLAKKGETGWIENIKQNLKHCETINDQLDAWCAHIPPQINLDGNDGFKNEFAYFVRGRALALREWIHRPFLYYVIHQPADDSFIAQALPLAEKCLQVCVQAQLRGFTFHRHHGIWYMARNSMTRALLILAAVKSERLDLPDGWREALDSALKTLVFWGEESPDLKSAADILTVLISDLT